MHVELHFEQAVLKHALSKHVHHFDYRDGIRGHLQRRGKVRRSERALSGPGSPREGLAQRIYSEEAPPPPARLVWPLVPVRAPTRESLRQRPCARWCRNMERYMEKQLFMDGSEEDVQDGHSNDWVLQVQDAEETPRKGSERRELSPTSPKPAKPFCGTDPQEEAWTRWQFLQHMPDYLSLIWEQKEHKEMVSKAKTSMLMSARRQLMACDLAVVLRVVSLFQDEDDRNLVREFAQVLSSETKTSRPVRQALPTVQRRASKLASLPGPLATESMGVRRQSIENMTDNIVEAIRLVSGKAKGGRNSSKPRPKGRRQSTSGGDRPSRSSMANNLLDSRRSSAEKNAEPEDAGAMSDADDAPTVDLLLEIVPAATRKRWGATLKVADADSESAHHRLALKIAHALRQKPQWFLVQDSIARGATSAQLVEPQPMESPLAPMAGDPRDVPLRCHCWLGALMILHHLPDLSEALSQSWQFQISLERLEKVAESVERAESLALCGGFALTLDVCRAQSSDLLSPLRPLHGSEAISPAWLKRVFETHEDEVNPYELGDELRLLVQCLAHQAAGAAFEEEIDSPAWEFTAEAWAHFCRTCLGENADGSDATAFAEVTHHLILGNGQPGDVSYKPMLGALILELLLQREVATRVRSSTEKVDNSDLHWRVEIINSSMQDYMPELMWQVMGWNTPAGRRILRRLSFAFFQVTSTTKNELSRKSFLRLCQQAGWDANFRSKSAGDAFFGSLFDDVVWSGGSADLLSFLKLTKMVAEIVVLPERGCCGIFAALASVCEDLTRWVQSQPDTSTSSRAASAPAKQALQVRPRRLVGTR